ncbi:MAG: fused MFS/spermidine synthase, partial [Pseudomonadota bacterium]
MPDARPSVWLAVTLTLVSAASMALEIVAGRALAPYVGMSLYSWTMIIAVVLAGLSLGHWIGGGLADRSRRPGTWVAAGLTGAAATSGISLMALRWVEPLVTGSNPIGHVGVLAFGAFFLPSVLAGVLSPLLTKMALDASAPGHHGRVVGRMFALGAF